MNGKYTIEVSNKKVTYRLEIKRNITIIQGDSGTGKTTLFRMINEYNRYGNSSGISLVCDKECIALTELNWQNYLSNAEEKIIFIDEDSKYIHTRDFSKLVNYSDNYFVLITRDSLPHLAYSINEIYGIRENRESQKYIEAKHVYNELFKLYNLNNIEKIVPTKVITEDSNSGYECFHKIFGDIVKYAGGKSLVTCKINDVADNNDEILAIVDGAAFGADIQEFLRNAKRLFCKCVLYAPESFEYIILKSEIIEVKKDILENTFNYADSKLYASWEQFFTAKLVEITNETIYKYNKHKLNEIYTTTGNIDKIKKQLPPLIDYDKELKK